MNPNPLLAAATVQVTLFDAVVTAGYLVAIVAVGCYVGLRHRRTQTGGEARGYFLAGGTLTWPVIGMALFATNISCVHLVSLAQAGFEEGFLQGNFEWMAAFTLVLLSLFFAPFYIRSRVATLPDFLEKRYGRACRDILAVFSLFSAIIIHIGFSLLTGSIVLGGLFGIDPWVSIVLIAVATAAYVVVGGLMAVVFTEAIETVVLLSGAALITFFAFKVLGGDAGVTGGWTRLLATLESPAERNMLSMLRPAGDASGMPWYAIFLGYPVLGIWYWCADQTIVQRVLGAKDENHARVGPLFAALIKILPVFLFVLPGLLFYAIVKSGTFADLQVVWAPGAAKAGLAQIAVDGTLTPIKTSEAYTQMIVRLLPTGLTGVMAAALIAALMSTVSGALNSISTLFSYDLWRRLRPETPDHRLVTIGRLAAVVAMLVAIGMVPILGRYGSIFRGINEIIAHLAPPVTAVFLWGVLWPGASYRGALVTMIGGAAAGALVFVLGKLGGDATPGFIRNTPFMMMAFYLFVFCSVLLFIASRALPKRPHEDPEQLHFKSLADGLAFRGWRGVGNYKFLSVLVVVIMAALFYRFR
ncbi:MAG: sodium:solute symporter family transporter [Limisphaerales bacterium]